MPRAAKTFLAVAGASLVFGPLAGTAVAAPERTPSSADQYQESVPDGAAKRRLSKREARELERSGVPGRAVAAVVQDGAATPGAVAVASSEPARRLPAGEAKPVASATAVAAAGSGVGSTTPFDAEIGSTPVWLLVAILSGVAVAVAVVRRRGAA